MPSPLVLLVDPDRDSRTIMHVILAHVGYRCAEATVGNIALKGMRLKLPDLVISEHPAAMHGGRDLAAALRDRIWTPLLVVTSRATPPEFAHAAAEGAVRVVAKPITPREVLAIVRELLGEPSAG